MQNKFGFHMCIDHSDDPYPKHEQVYVETTVQNIGTLSYAAESVQKTTKFNMKTETVEEDPA